MTDEMLLFIDEHVTAESRTLETGAGVTTVLFAMKGCRHTCIVPFPDEVERIKAFCTEQGISHDRVTFVTERSEFALPHLRPEPLDLVLIDGAHGFPTPLIELIGTLRRIACALAVSWCSMTLSSGPSACSNSFQCKSPSGT